MAVQLLAHAGPGSTWQAMVTVVALGFAAVVVLTALGRVELAAPGDLILPVAAVAILSSLAPLGDAWLSDWIGWAFPVGGVALVALLLAAFTRLELSLRGVLPYATLVLAIVGGVTLHEPLTVAWHPPPDYLPEPGDTELVIREPADGDEVPAGGVRFEVAVADGSIAGERVPFEELGADPADGGTLEVAVDGERVEIELEQRCTVDEPCREAAFTVPLPAGEVAVRVEFLRGDGMPFSPAVGDRVELLAE